MGPLSGFRIIELSGIGPGPFCGMMLGDMGADVIRIDRPGGNPSSEGGHDILFRNRRAVAVNLKHPDGVKTVLKLCEKADAIFEGYRPGVAERLGVGPEQCMAANPKLVYGRMTGWGQQGPMALAAGHDINYIALTGALHAIGRRGEKPMPPLNLVGDFGGGGMLMAFGIVCALLEAQKSGKGQVVDAAMVDGASALMAMFYGLKANGLFGNQRGTHLLDTGAHFYDVYETKDGKYISIGSIEPQFYALLMELAGLSQADFGHQFDINRWPELKVKIAGVFKTKTREEWCDIMEGSDVCFAPVLDLDEAPQHEHAVARGAYQTVGKVVHPSPAPRFSRTATHSNAVKPMTRVGTDTHAVLADYGFAAGDVERLLAAGAIAAL